MTLEIVCYVRQKTDVVKFTYVETLTYVQLGTKSRIVNVTITTLDVVMITYVKLSIKFRNCRYNVHNIKCDHEYRLICLCKFQDIMNEHHLWLNAYMWTLPQSLSCIVRHRSASFVHLLHRPFLLRYFLDMAANQIQQPRQQAGDSATGFGSQDSVPGALNMLNLDSILHSKALKAQGPQGSLIEVVMERRLIVCLFFRKRIKPIWDSLCTLLCRPVKVRPVLVSQDSEPGAPITKLRMLLRWDMFRRHFTHNRVR